MEFLIIGHTGFIGSEIFNLLKNKNLTVLGINSNDIDLTKTSSINKLSGLISNKTHLIMCAGIKRQLGDNFKIWEKNEKLNLNFTSAIIKSPPKHLTYISSAAVFGDDVIHKKKICENTKLIGTSYYSISKINSENIILKVSKQYNFPVCILRPPLIYGIGDKSKGYGPTGFCYSALENNLIEIWGDGTEMREFIWIKDLGKICYLLSQRKFNGILNCVSGKSYNYMDIIKSLNKILKNKFEYNFKKRSKQKINNVFSAYKIKRELKDFKFTKLNDGLKLLIEEFREKEIDDRKK